MTGLALIGLSAHFGRVLQADSLPQFTRGGCWTLSPNRVISRVELDGAVRRAFLSDRWRRIACVLAALTSEACSAEDLAARAEAGAERRTTQGISRLISAWDEANDSCRDNALSEGSLSCARRDQLDQQLAYLGFCYGEGVAYGYQAEWARCQGALGNHGSSGSSRADNGLTATEQEKAEQIAAAYARDALVQAEVERQLSEKRLSDERRARQALELIQ